MITQLYIIRSNRIIFLFIDILQSCIFILIAVFQLQESQGVDATTQTTGGEIVKTGNFSIMVVD